MARACILVLPIRVVAIGVAAIGLFASCDARPRQPNVLLILADDLGWNDVGYHGSEIRTPHLDALATEGVRLESFYVQPYCSATRAALLTGRYPMRMGLQKGLIRPWEKDGLPLEERTLAEALKGAGYATAALGKWHLGAAREAYLPLWRGFDHHYGHYNGAIDYFTHELYGGLDWHRNGIAVDEEGYATDLLADEAVRWIRRVDPGRPFFLYLAFNAPHSPLQAPDEQRDRYPEIDDPRRRIYAAMVSALDDGVGRIVAALEEDGRLDDTIVVFASDNGGHPKAEGDNTPLRGQKGNAYEGGIRVPAFVFWRGRLPAGRVTNV
ncbi:MAG: arylsulfatase, partial [Proteobacteria bacterium]|nr:arylsulfatase [Pseudomonadota bacterium]